MTIFDIAPLSEWRTLYRMAQRSIDDGHAPPLLRAILNADLQTLLRMRAEKLIQVYGHIKVQETVDYLLTATSGELNDIARRLVVANPDLADDFAMRLLEAGDKRQMTPEQVQRVREQLLAAIIGDAIEHADANHDPVPDAPSGPHRRGRISSTAD